MTGALPLSGHAAELLATIAKTEETLLALDYDGTLAPIASRPDEARVPTSTTAILERLAACPRYRLAIVSGRALDDLRRRIPAAHVLVGNHGLEIDGDGVSFRHEEAAALANAVVRACDDIERALDGTPGAFVERKGMSATVHYRNTPTLLVPLIKETVLAAAAPYAEKVFVKSAAKALELRPRVRWNKGLAVCLLLGHMTTAHPGLLTAGDDATDEDMFSISPREISIKVGDAHATRARYHAKNPADLAAFLEQLP